MQPVGFNAGAALTGRTGQKPTLDPGAAENMHTPGPLLRGGLCYLEPLSDSCISSFKSMVFFCGRQNHLGISTRRCSRENMSSEPFGMSARRPTSMIIGQLSANSGKMVPLLVQLLIIPICNYTCSQAWVPPLHMGARAKKLHIHAVVGLSKHPALVSLFRWSSGHAFIIWGPACTGCHWSPKLCQH